jgi:hypothetical protein
MPVSDHQSPAVHLRGVVKRYDQITAVDGSWFAVLIRRLAIWRMTIRLLDQVTV